MPGHAHAPHDRARKQTLPNGTGTSPPALGPVRSVASTEIVAFHHSFETAAFGNSNGVNKIPLGKNSRANHIPGFYGESKITKFANPLNGNSRVLLEVTQEPLTQAMIFLLIK